MSAMLDWFMRQSREKRTAHKIYGSIVTQARAAVFYAELGVPDTLEGRFEVLVLHLFLILQRLQADGERGAAVSQELVDLFVSDMDTTFRELGIGDASVPKRVRNTAKVFQTRLRAYQEAATDADLARLSGVVETTVFADVADAPARHVSGITAYALTAVAHLARQPLADLEAGRLDLPLPEPDGSETPLERAQ